MDSTADALQVDRLQHPAEMHAGHTVEADAHLGMARCPVLFFIATRAYRAVLTSSEGSGRATMQDVLERSGNSRCMQHMHT